MRDSLLFEFWAVVVVKAVAASLAFASLLSSFILGDLSNTRTISAGCPEQTCPSEALDLVSCCCWERM